MPMLSVFGLGVSELLIILAVLSMVLVIGVVGIILALLVIRTTRSRPRVSNTTTPPSA